MHWDAIKHLSGAEGGGVAHALGCNYAVYLGPSGAGRSGVEWGRVGLGGAPGREWGRVGLGWGWVGLGRGWACIGMQLNNCLRPSWAKWGRVGLGGVGEGLGMHWDAIKQVEWAEWSGGQVGRSGAGWGWGGVGHGMQLNNSNPTWAEWGRAGPGGAGWG